MSGATTETERDDAELAGYHIGGDMPTVFQHIVWSHIRTASLEHALLVAAELGGLPALEALISQSTPARRFF